MEIKIKQKWPPNVDAIRARFPDIHQQCIFAYGDTIYSPSSIKIPQFLIVHEKTHFAQQAAMGGPDAWWERYLSDDKFLIEQEVEAYHNQYEYFCTTTSDRSARYKHLMACVKDLSSPIYGRTIGIAAALFRIKFGK